MAYLKFSSDDFRTLPVFSKFVKDVLSNRNDQTEVTSLEVTFNEKVSRVYVKRIFDYVCSHNVQQLNMSCLRGMIECPLPLFSSQPLKHRIWKLSALATLKLVAVALYDDNTIEKGDSLFSNCENMKNLTLISRVMTGRNGLNVCHPGLIILTLNYCDMDANVVTPQLKNLAIKDWSRKFQISAPNLSSFDY